MCAYHDDWEIVYTIKEDDKTIVVFFFDQYKGNRYANVRKCIESPTFKGPTKKGLKFKEDLITPILSGLRELRQTDLQDGLEIVNIRKSSSIDIIVNVVKNDNGHFGIDIREFSTSGNYVGPKKNGIRVGYEHVSKLIEGFELLRDGT
jgi:hypothetical protein